ncbi:acetyl-CoA carboxylase biotin carboxyl carrier protein subunit [Lactiplantibacillus plantarum]|uniref:acetyl-CoA carboxylase biotin carboxyl carrier protein n=1 Tax=Lactiplantibacillus plantarum TaxID=1590 RepID=UPI00156F0BC3|nr:acetyl-CoA carboxylase biotin carboxyl carrier protein subunit [Lactiplantibacillus plantarum]MBY7656484.1 acetyl-CoA carboxylase biotin carboxyl carrier protein subunit [Lactiplantibacillus plantarum]QKK58458.1 acetyl-CoA carboxylase biotin carboxyl carrier protein subunit [Lactiplantibacillus plantarum]QSE52164.1 acetyl-CoA carboxylase biotin carboxyl carrier protein subunit [Lactiplantibacillus plantarum]
MNNLIDLLTLMDRYGLSFLEYRSDEMSVRMRRDDTNHQMKSTVPDIRPKLTEKHLKKVNNSDLLKITSPIVGIFHQVKEVNEGSKVAKGDVLGRIESMKMFTDVPSPSDGIVKKIEVDDESPVEFEQELIEIDKQ